MRHLFSFALPIALVALAGAVACGSDGSTDRVAAACGRIVDAECAKLAECKAVESGTTVTSALCAQIRATAVSDCQTSQGAGISAATDSDVDGCVQGFAAVQCADICNQIPQDPAACQKISPDPNTDTVTCSN